jgi:hypothetical protein
MKTCSVILALFVLMQGCSMTPPRLPAVPSELTARAEIPGMTGVRYVAGGDMTELTRIGTQALQREQAYLAKQGYKEPLPPAVYLAISGGGDNGAFTAGLVNGWTARGKRPEFKLVTGISTSALIASFAFLGPKYDAKLKKVYSQGIGDLYRIYATAQRDGVDFNLGFIPSSFNAPHKEEFDNEYMRKLYSTGYDLALQGFPWLKVPPGFTSPSVTAEKDTTRGLYQKRSSL